MFRVGLSLEILIILILSAVNMAAPFLFGSSLILTIIILLTSFNIIFRSPKSNFLKNNVLRFYIVLGLVAFISIVFRLVKGNVDDFVYQLLGNLSRALFLILTLSIANTIEKTFFFRSLKSAILIGSLSIILFSIFKIDLANSVSGFFTANQTRFSGFYLNANFGGVIIAIGHLLLIEKKVKLLKSEQFIFILAVLFTFSFTALLILFYNLFTNNKAVFISIVSVLILVFSLGWESFNFSQARYQKLQLVADFYKGGGVNIDELTTGRYSLWKKGISDIINKPILGNGFGYMATEVKTNTKKKYKYGVFNKTNIGIHNNLLEILGDYGILIGSLIVILFFKLVITSKVGFAIMLAFLTGHGLIYSMPFAILIFLNNKQNE
ncbi:hypothetical protein OBA38_00670 [bacterium]|nr:hypothetical protein [bacterium]